MLIVWRSPSTNKSLANPEARLWWKQYVGFCPVGFENTMLGGSLGIVTCGFIHGDVMIRGVTVVLKSIHRHKKYDQLEQPCGQMAIYQRESSSLLVQVSGQWNFSKLTALHPHGFLYYLIADWQRVSEGRKSDWRLVTDSGKVERASEDLFKRFIAYLYRWKTCSKERAKTCSIKASTPLWNCTESRQKFIK